LSRLWHRRQAPDIDSGVKTSIVSLALLAAACSPGTKATGTPDSGHAAGGNPVVEVGTGSAEFVPLKNGDSVPIIHGPQGGTHIWGSVSVQHLTPGTVSVTYAVSSQGSTLSSTTYQLDASGDPWTWAGFIGVVPDPMAIDGQTVTLTMTVKDARGNAGSDQRQVVAHDAAGGVGGTGPAQPAPRNDFAAAIDAQSEKLVLFGGDVGTPVQCNPQPAFDAETWIFDLKSKVWQRVPGAGPSARSRHSGLIDEKRHRFIVFGGRYRDTSSGSTTYTVYNEVWAFDLSTSTWTQLMPTGTPPPGLANTLAVYDAAGDRMIVYGGNSSTSGLAFQPHSETWALSLADNKWSRLGSNAPRVPPYREYQTGAIDAAGGRLLVFAGAGNDAFGGSFYNDLWSFDLTAEVWTQLQPAGTTPQGRIRSKAALDAANGRLLIFGGHDDGALGERNELLAVQFNPRQWVSIHEGDTLKTMGQAFCDFPPDFTTPDLASPERREAHFFGFDAADQQFVMYGGETDCGNIGDVWSLDPGTTRWTRLVRSYVGESCQRSGKQDCTSLCL
jgi:N-acetylneuraminic acid mutarotase